MGLTSRAKRFGHSVKKVVTKTFRAVMSQMRGSQRGKFPGRGGGGRGGSGGRGGGSDQVSRVAQGLGAIKMGPETDSRRSVHVVTNHFELRWTGGDKGGEFTVHQYQVIFTPTDLAIRVKKFIMAKLAEDTFHGAYVYDGSMQLFCSNKFGEQLEVMSGKENRDESSVEYTLRLEFVKSLPQSDPIYLQIYNLIVRKCLFGMGLEELGSNFYDTGAIINYPNLKVQLWPGYITTMQHNEKGLMLCVDVTHKVIRDIKLLTVINELKAKYPEGRTPLSMEEYILKEIRGSMVITEYNKKPYRVDGIRLDLNPASSFEWKGETTTFMEYYRNRYQQDIKDLGQPLVISNMKSKKGEAKESGEIVLIPEFCNVTGLTDEMRANMGVMRELSLHLHLAPSERVNMLQTFMERLAGSEKCQETLNEWGFAFGTKVAPCTIGNILPSQTISFANEKTFLADDKNDFTRALRCNQMIVSVSLNQWIVITGERDFSKAQDFVQTMKKVATPLGFFIGPPATFERLQDVRISGYARSLDNIVTSLNKDEIQMILCILPNNNADLYNMIKRRLSHDHGIVSQCLLAKNLTSKNAMSIATKLVIQMNTKLGGEPWTIPLPVELEKNSIVIGFDYTGRGRRTGYLVTTSNDTFSRYYSFIFSYSDSLELITKLNEHIIRCLEIYKTAQSKLPKTVIFYRNNVEEGFVKNGVIEIDATGLNNAIQSWLKQNELKEEIQLVYMVMAKKSTTRLMSHTGDCDPDKGGINPSQVRNPPVGTVVDKNIVAKDGKYQEFFMVTTVARQGTARAVQYRVILNTKEIPPEVLQAFTYKMCHLYYNWSGAVNLPAVCQYAAKLAKQTSQTMPGCEPHTAISNLLHFL